MVSVHALPIGVWHPPQRGVVDQHHLGMFLVDGILAREFLIEDSVSTELMGAGDVPCPWKEDHDERLLRHDVRWNVLTTCRVALLDRQFAAGLARWPQVSATIMDRVHRRALRLATTQAISQLNRVDRRLLALFWHLAERWGQMTPDGMKIGIAAGIVIAAIARIVLYVIIGIPLWIAFVVAAAIIAAVVFAGGAKKTAQ